MVMVCGTCIPDTMTLGFLLADALSKISAHGLPKLSNAFWRSSVGHHQNGYWPVNHQLRESPLNTLPQLLVECVVGTGEFPCCWIYVDEHIYKAGRDFSSVDLFFPVLNNTSGVYFKIVSSYLSFWTKNLFDTVIHPFDFPCIHCQWIFEQRWCQYLFAHRPSVRCTVLFVVRRLRRAGSFGDKDKELHTYIHA